MLQRSVRPAPNFRRSEPVSATGVVKGRRKIESRSRDRPLDRLRHRHLHDAGNPLMRDLFRVDTRSA